MLGSKGSNNASNVTEARKEITLPDQNELPNQQQFAERIGGLSANDPFELIQGIRDAAYQTLGEDVTARTQPFGIVFARQVEPAAVADSTGTTATVSVTIAVPPDSDSDPSDTD